MGQAKQRGNKAERVAQALQREAEERAQWEAIRAERRKQELLAEARMTPEQLEQRKAARRAMVSISSMMGMSSVISRIGGGR